MPFKVFGNINILTVSRLVAERHLIPVVSTGVVFLSVSLNCLSTYLVHPLFKEIALEFCSTEDQSIMVMEIQTMQPLVD